MKKRAPQGVQQEAFEAAKTPAGLAAERETYANNWSTNDAAAFEQAGLYAWMASHIRDHHRVLEIGTGDGRGTVELLRAGHPVVSVDENPACLNLAEKTISNAGFTAALVLRGTAYQADDGYMLKYQAVSLSPAATGAVLVEGDTLNDYRLLSWLKTLPRFDAIVCWLVGSHRARQLNIKLPLADAAQYRLRVQNHLYELADELLQSGGILHIVDRSTVGTKPAAIKLLDADLIRAHKEQASPTSLEVDPTVQTIPYAPPSAGLKMQLSLGTSGLVPTDITLGLTSIIARKP